MASQHIRSATERKLGLLRVHEARSPDTPEQRLRELATDPIRPVRIWAARNPNTPPDAIALLSQDADFSVRDSALRPRTPAVEELHMGRPQASGDVVPGASEWLPLLRALDEPGRLGSAVGLDFPSDFDRATTQNRFDQLAEGLSQAFGCPLAGGQGPQEDAARFGVIRIPAELTHTHDQRSGDRLPLAVVLSNFGGLTTCLPYGIGPLPDPVHQEDHRRIEQVSDELRLRFVPGHFLDAPYEGVNQWVFGPTEATWFQRFFDYL